MTGARRRSTRAFRPGTVANQDSHILLFIAFSIYFGLRDFPASAAVLICFAEFLLRTYSATKSVLNAISSVRRFHLDGRYDVAAFDDVTLSRWRRALPLTVRTLPVRATAIPLGALERLCRLAETMGQEGLTMAAFLAVCFRSFARASTLLAAGPSSYDFSRLPTFADIQRRGTGVLLYIEWGKTHQAVWEAFQVPLLPRTDSLACPVRALEALLARQGKFPSMAPLLATPRVRGGQRVLQNLTITQARQWLRLLLRLAGFAESQYSLHSLRRGGAPWPTQEARKLRSYSLWGAGGAQLYTSITHKRMRGKGQLWPCSPPTPALPAIPYQTLKTLRL